ncbi:MAG: pyrimidine 5'-nucleotidase [Rhodospirillales bacterium]
MAAHSLKDRSCWVFDLDNTLYDSRYNLFHQIDLRMRAFVQEFLRLGPDDAFRVQKQYFREYGTTLRGLMARHALDPAPYLAHVHDIDLSMIPPNPELDALLAALPGRKVIFTNASANHAERVVERLGIARHFDGCLDIVGTNYVPKPERATYDQLVAQFGLSPTSCVMVEDMARNLKPAKDLGMATVWVETESDFAREGGEDPHVDYRTTDLTGWLADVLA